MSGEPEEIACRTCNEIIPADAGNCPNCGTSVRGLTGPIAAAVIGAILAVASLTNVQQLWVYGLLGLVILAIGAGLVFDKRRRIQSA